MFHIFTFIWTEMWTTRWRLTVSLLQRLSRRAHSRCFVCLYMHLIWNMWFFSVCVWLFIQFSKELGLDLMFITFTNLSACKLCISTRIVNIISVTIVHKKKSLNMLIQKNTIIYLSNNINLPKNILKTSYSIW